MANGVNPPNFGNTRGEGTPRSRARRGRTKGVTRSIKFHDAEMVARVEAKLSERNIAVNAVMCQCMEMLDLALAELEPFDRKIEVTYTIYV